MVILDMDATFVKIDKLRERIERIENNPDPNEWHHTRLLIRALTETVAKAKKSSGQAAHKVRLDAPEALRADWDELVDVLMRKGIKAEK
jgi:hypothetical protein